MKGERARTACFKISNFDKEVRSKYFNSLIEEGMPDLRRVYRSYFRYRELFFGLDDLKQRILEIMDLKFQKEKKEQDFYYFEKDEIVIICKQAMGYIFNVACNILKNEVRRYERKVAREEKYVKVVKQMENPEGFEEHFSNIFSLLDRFPFSKQQKKLYGLVKAGTSFDSISKEMKMEKKLLYTRKSRLLNKLRDYLHKQGIKNF